MLKSLRMLTSKVIFIGRKRLTLPSGLRFKMIFFARTVITLITFVTNLLFSSLPRPHPYWLVCRGQASEGSLRIFGEPAVRPHGIVGQTWYVFPLIYPSFVFIFEFLISFPPFFHPGRNPILPRAGLLPLWCLTGRGLIFAGGRCFSA